MKISTAYAGVRHHRFYISSQNLFNMFLSLIGYRLKYKEDVSGSLRRLFELVTRLHGVEFN